MESGFCSIIHDEYNIGNHILISCFTLCMGQHFHCFLQALYFLGIFLQHMI